MSEFLAFDTSTTSPHTVTRCRGSGAPVNAFRADCLSPRVVSGLILVWGCLAAVAEPAGERNLNCYIEVRVAVGGAEYRANHPVFDEKRNEVEVSLGEMVRFSEPLGVEHVYLFGMAAYQYARSNIDFFDRSISYGGVGFGYTFQANHRPESWRHDRRSVAWSERM